MQSCSSQTAMFLIGKLDHDLNWSRYLSMTSTVAVLCLSMRVYSSVGDHIRRIFSIIHCLDKFLSQVKYRYRVEEPKTYGVGSSCIGVGNETIRIRQEKPLLPSQKWLLYIPFDLLC